MNNKVIYLEIDGTVEANQQIPSAIWITALTGVSSQTEDNEEVITKLQFSGITTRYDALASQASVKRTRIRVTDSVTFQRIAVVCQTTDAIFRSKPISIAKRRTRKKVAESNLVKEDKSND